METPEEPRDPCWLWSGNLSFRPQLQMRTSDPTATAEDSLRAPRESSGDWTSLWRHERVSEVSVETQEEPHSNSRKTRRFFAQCELSPFSTAASREKSHLPSCTLKGSSTPLKQLKKFPDIPVCTREEHVKSCHNSRRAPVLRPHPERRVPVHASSVRESRHSCHTSRGGGLHLTHESNSRGRATISKDPRCPSALQTHLTPLH